MTRRLYVDCRIHLILCYFHLFLMSYLQWMAAKRVNSISVALSSSSAKSQNEMARKKEPDKQSFAGRTEIRKRDRGRDERERERERAREKGERSSFMRYMVKRTRRLISDVSL
jgi:hypothetical protein